MPTTTLDVSSAWATLTICGGADGVEVYINGATIGPVAKGATDVDTATAVANAINAHPFLGQAVRADNEGQVITLTSRLPGAVGNTLTLEPGSTSAGQALFSGYTLSGGVTVTISY